MYFEEIGHKIREVRKAKGLTQLALAHAANLSRTTINQLESGVFPDIGMRKLQAILEVIGLDVSVTQKQPLQNTQSDFLELACISANVSYRGRLSKQALAQTLVTGKVPKDKRPHLRVVFDEIPLKIFQGMIQQVGSWTSDEKIRKNIISIAKEINSSRKMHA